LRHGCAKPRPYRVFLLAKGIEEAELKPEDL